MRFDSPLVQSFAYGFSFALVLLAVRWALHATQLTRERELMARRPLRTSDRSTSKHKQTTVAILDVTGSRSRSRCRWKARRP